MTSLVEGQQRVRLIVGVVTGLFLAVAVIFAVIFLNFKVEEGKRNEDANRADQRALSSLV